MIENIEKEEVLNFAKEQNKVLADIIDNESYSDEKKYYSNFSPEQNKILGEVNILLTNYNKELEETHDIKLYGEKQDQKISFMHKLENEGFPLHNYILGCRVKGGAPEPYVTEFDTPNHDIEEFVKDLYKD